MRELLVGRKEGRENKYKRILSGDKKRISKVKKEKKDENKIRKGMEQKSD